MFIYETPLSFTELGIIQLQAIFSFDRNLKHFQSVIYDSNKFSAQNVISPCILASQHFRPDKHS